MNGYPSAIVMQMQTIAISTVRQTRAKPILQRMVWRSSERLPSQLLAIVQWVWSAFRFLFWAGFDCMHVRLLCALWNWNAENNTDCVRYAVCNGMRVANEIERLASNRSSISAKWNDDGALASQSTGQSTVSIFAARERSAQKSNLKQYYTSSSFF